mgnify:FL=1
MENVVVNFTCNRTVAGSNEFVRHIDIQSIFTSGPIATEGRGNNESILIWI